MKKNSGSKPINDILLATIPGSILVIGMFLGMMTTEDWVMFGIYPRSFVGLRGILFTPFIHADWMHFFSNMSGIWVLMALLTFFYKEIWFSVITWIWFLDGFWVWAGARESYHIGASGIVYGLAGFIFLSGIMRNNRSLKIISLLVVMFYGGLVWGVIPIDPKMSWEAHLFGLIAGFITAFFYRNDGPANEPDYTWVDDIADDAYKYWEIGALEEMDESEMNPQEGQEQPVENVNSEEKPWKFTYHYKPKDD